MFKSFASFSAVVFLITGLFNGSAFGCACCSEPGTYSLGSGRLQDHERVILKQIKFDKRASLYMTEAGFDTIKGLSSIEKDFFDGSGGSLDGDFDLANSYTGKFWTFTFKLKNGKSGTVRLPVPTRMTTFKVDIHDGSDKGLGPLLYKEFRFKGTVASGSGFLGGSIANPTTYYLVFQGRGLACDDVADFRNWNLEITGRKAGYQFYGKLSSSKESATAKASVTFRSRNSIDK
jgi:hypothetical protein